MTSSRDSQILASLRRPKNGVRLGAAALAFVSSLAAAHVASAAETVAYEVKTTTGNQDFSGSIGMDFDVVRAIDVYELGVFDDGADGFANELTAYIYDRDTQALVTKVTFAAGTTGRLASGTRFLPLPCPLHLPVDFHGSIVADGFSTADKNGNRNTPPTPAEDDWVTHDGGGALSFTGLSRYGVTPGVYPATADAYVDNYAAGSFVFTEACTANTDCTNAARPTCANGLCGASTGSFFAGCTGATASCDTQTATCTACTADYPATDATACRTADMPACVAGACVKCSASNAAACTDEATPSCGEDNTCQTCQTDFDDDGPAKCPTEAKSKCLATGKCAECAEDADCDTGKECNASGECVDAPEEPDAGTDGGTDAGTDGGKDAGKDSGGPTGADAGTTDSGSPGSNEDGGAVAPIDPTPAEDDGGCSVSSSSTSGGSFALLGVCVALVISRIRRKR